MQTIESVPDRLPGRRQALITILAFCGATSMPLRSIAQGRYPDRPVRMIVPFAVGGGSDVIGRLLAERLSGQIKQSVVVDNRSGAGGSIGAAQLLQAAPDGYSLLFTSLAPVTIAPNLPGMKPGYDAHRDFLPVAMIAQQPVLIVVNAKSPAKSLGELVALAKKKPGAMSYATPGVGTELHMIGEMLKQAAGIDLVHVPYRGGGPAITDLLAGNVDMMPVVTSSILPHVRSGAVRVLATTHASRLAELPQVATAGELGYKGLVSTPSWGLFARTGTDAAAIQAVSAALGNIDRDADYRRRLAEMGALPKLLETAPFTTYVEQESAQWKQLIDHARLRSD